MNERLKALYQEVIVRQSREPYHFAKIEEIDPIEAYNPLCGDQYRLYVQPSGDRLGKLYFHGYGCAISKASASVLVRSLEGLSLTEARQKVAQFLSVVQTESPLPEEETPDDFMAFAAARSFPARLKCASLCWEAMQTFLKV